MPTEKVRCFTIYNFSDKIVDNCRMEAREMQQNQSEIV